MAVEAEVAHGGGGHVQGMPQLFFETYPNQIFWLVITLVVIWWILSRIALPRISSVLAERAGTITNDLAAAEELSLKVQEAERAYEKALADARTEASRIVAEARAEIRAELDAAKAEADARIASKSAESEAAIAAIRASASENIAEVATATARELIAALGGAADEGAVAAAVAARIGE